MMVIAARIMVAIQKRTVTFDSNQQPFGQLNSTLTSGASCPGRTLNASWIGARLNTLSFSPFLLPHLDN